MNRVFQAIALCAGAAVTALPFLSYIVEVPASELGYELTGAGTGALLLFSPYVGLAVLAKGARRLIGYGALVLLLIGSGMIHALASGDAQGGLIAVYIIPAQWLVAALAGSSRLSSARPADPS